MFKILKIVFDHNHPLPCENDETTMKKYTKQINPKITF